MLIARGILLADATPGLRPLLLPESASVTRQLLQGVKAPAFWNFLLEHRIGRSVLFAAERLLLPGILLHWLVRKCLLDALAREAVQAGCRQIVVLGAGLDTLAWRFRDAAACFELDHPATQAIKERMMTDGPKLVSADLSQVSVTSALRAEPEFDANRPTLFVAEGLLMYLPEADVAALFRELAVLGAPGSRFAFTFMEARPGQPLAFHGESRLIGKWLRWRSEPFKWGLERTAVPVFAKENGWRLDSLSSPDELRSRFLAPHGLGHQALALGESVALLHLPSR